MCMNAHVTETLIQVCIIRAIHHHCQQFQIPLFPFHNFLSFGILPFAVVPPSVELIGNGHFFEVGCVNAYYLVTIVTSARYIRLKQYPIPLLHHITTFSPTQRNAYSTILVICTSMHGIWLPYSPWLVT